MPKSPPSLDQKLALIQSMISSRRRNILGFADGYEVTGTPRTDTDEIIVVLKSIDADLRAASPGGAVETRRVLGEKIAAIVRARTAGTSLGFQSGKLIALAQEVVGRWRTLEAALEKHGVDVRPEVEELREVLMK